MLSGYGRIAGSKASAFIQPFEAFTARPNGTEPIFYGSNKAPGPLPPLQPLLSSQPRRIRPRGHRDAKLGQYDFDRLALSSLASTPISGALQQVDVSYANRWGARQTRLPSCQLPPTSVAGAFSSGGGRWHLVIRHPFQGRVLPDFSSAHRYRGPSLRPLRRRSGHLCSTGDLQTLPLYTY